MSTNRAVVLAREPSRAERKVWPQGLVEPSCGTPRDVAAIFDPSSDTTLRPIGSYPLGLVVPKGALVTRAFYQVLTSFATAGGNAGTLALQVEAAGDLVAPIAVSDPANPWAQGRVEVPFGSAASEFQRTVVKATFDPSGTSGLRTVAAHTLGVTIPAGAIALKAWYDVRVGFTSAASTATIALSLEGANDLVSAIAINDASSPWNAGVHPVSMTALPKTTVARTLTATVAVQALTAGTLDLYVEYLSPVLRVARPTTTADREIKVVVAGQALTAGKAVFFVEYLFGG